MKTTCELTAEEFKQIVIQQIVGSNPNIKGKISDSNIKVLAKTKDGSTKPLDVVIVEINHGS